MKSYDSQLNAYLKQNNTELRQIKRALIPHYQCKPVVTPAQRRRLRKKNFKECKHLAY